MSEDAQLFFYKLNGINSFGCTRHPMSLWIEAVAGCYATVKELILKGAVRRETGRQYAVLG